MIPGFPENLAFDDLAFDNFTIIRARSVFPLNALRAGHPSVG